MSNETKRITETTLTKLAAKAQERFIRDTEQRGFQIKVTPSGHAAYFVETIFLYEQVKNNIQGSIAVVGTGAGLLPILFSSFVNKVIGLEINPYAVSLSKKNAVAYRQ